MDKGFTPKRPLSAERLLANSITLETGEDKFKKAHFHNGLDVKEHFDEWPGRFGVGV
jgi:hypothetical protein